MGCNMSFDISVWNAPHRVVAALDYIEHGGLLISLSLGSCQLHLAKVRATVDNVLALDGRPPALSPVPSAPSGK